LKQDVLLQPIPGFHIIYIS